MTTTIKDFDTNEWQTIVTGVTDAISLEIYDQYPT